MKKAFPKSIWHMTHYVLLHVPNVYNVTWHEQATNINKEELGEEINNAFKFRRGKCVATHSTTNVIKIEKQKIFVAQLNAISRHELAVLNSQHASIQSTFCILAKTHVLPTTIDLSLSSILRMQISQWHSSINYTRTPARTTPLKTTGRRHNITIWLWIYVACVKKKSMVKWCAWIVGIPM